MLGEGIPLHGSLGLAIKILHNPLLEREFVRAQQKMMEGEALSHTLSQSSLIPSLILRMFNIGEQTGQMHSVVTKLAELYEEDLDRDLLQLTTFLQPALLLLLGLIVGVVVLSILLPLTDVSSFLSS